jgi:hypothetical protein
MTVRSHRRRRVFFYACSSFHHPREDRLRQLARDAARAADEADGAGSGGVRKPYRNAVVARTKHRNSGGVRGVEFILSEQLADARVPMRQRIAWIIAIVVFGVLLIRAAVIATMVPYLTWKGFRDGGYPYWAQALVVWLIVAAIGYLVYRSGDGAGGDNGR